MRCCDVEALWDELRDGSEPRKEHVLAHLRICPPCQKLYEQYEGVAYCLNCLPLPEPPQTMVPKILEHIRASVARANPKPDCLARVESPVGPLLVAFRSTGITYIGIVRDDEHAAIERITQRLRRPVVLAQAPDWVVAVIDEYFRSQRVDFDRIDISDLTAFEQAVLRKSAEIPPGETRSYGWIAREIGNPTAARAVGQVMARNPVAILYPCHRVVDSQGALHNYGYGLEAKAHLLAIETGDAARTPAQR
jgi:methylated-DNA-[protein]-cysteine S-methyltransferase